MTIAIESSALQPAGVEAAEVATLFWIMLAAGTLIWTLTLVAAWYAAYGRKHDPDAGADRRPLLLIAGGGVVIPTVLLGALLWRGLSQLDSGLRPVQPDLRIAVTGERFWWRVQYLDSSGNHTAPVTLANELRIPVGQRTELRLSSPEVIHSLWIPSLAGKVDMMPGRETRMILEPTRTGRFRGICAEYCGTGHANMMFTVDVLPADVFDQWLRAQSQPALASTATTRGGELFASNGCPACHSIRGTGAKGVIGPDLTHVGSRPTLAAMALPMNAENQQRWIHDSVSIKPGSLMPGFQMIPDEELRLISDYLMSLK